jgi:ribosomal protein S3
VAANIRTVSTNASNVAANIRNDLSHVAANIRTVSTNASNVAANIRTDLSRGCQYQNC